MATARENYQTQGLDYMHQTLHNPDYGPIDTNVRTSWYDHLIDTGIIHPQREYIVDTIDTFSKTPTTSGTKPPTPGSGWQSMTPSERSAFVADKKIINQHRKALEVKAEGGHRERQGGRRVVEAAAGRRRGPWRSPTCRRPMCRGGCRLPS